MAKRKAHRRSRRSVLHGLLQRTGDLLVWTLVVVAPFALAVTAADAFRLPKLLLSEWLGLASLLAYALAAAVGPAPAPAAVPFWKRPAVLAVAPVLVVATAGLAATDHPAHVRRALPDLWIAAACLVGWTLALDRVRLERLVRGVAIPGALMAFLGALQFHGVFRPFRFTGGEEAIRLGVTGLAGNPGDLGAYLVLPALVAQWGLARSVAARRRAGGGSPWLPLALWSVALVAAVYGLAVTQTLTALAALLAATTVFWLVALPARRAVAAGAAVLCLVAAFAVLVPPLRERVATAGGLAARGEWNTLLTGRLDGWRAAGWMVREEPWTGVGHGAFRAEFAEARLALQDRGVQFYRGHVDPFFANAHNELLNAAAEWGLPGLVAVLWAVWLLLRSLAAGDGSRAGRTGAWAPAFGWGGLAGAAVLAAGHFPFHLALVAFPYLVFFAWVFRRAGEPEEAAP